MVSIFVVTLGMFYVVKSHCTCFYAQLQNSTTRENETLLAIGTAYLQGEDVAARGRVLLFSVERNNENSQTSVTAILFSQFMSVSFVLVLYPSLLFFLYVIPLLILLIHL